MDRHDSAVRRTESATSSPDDARTAFVLGTRPEIIKMAPVITECHRTGLSPYVIHTGQHYSESLDVVFFEQLDLDRPAVNLGIGSGTHAEQTGEMLVGIERELQSVEPEVVFVQGDTNSTLAGALAGAKLDVDVAHIEAGLRSYDREMPEEVNRIVVDHLADYLFAPTEETARHLREEGRPADAITVTGNTVVDALKACERRAAATSTILSELDLTAGEFYLLTAHRQENVDDPERFANILEGVARFASSTRREVIYPIHPRAQDRLDQFGLVVPDTIRTVDPLDFLDFLRLETTAALAFTDSGGVQEETCVLGTPCVTLRHGTERPETVYVGANCVAGCRPEDIVAAARRMYGKAPEWDSPFGDGNAATRIVDTITDDSVREAVPGPT